MENLPDINSINWTVVTGIIGLVFSIISFFLGKLYEKKIRTDQTRLDFISFIESWCENITRLNAMVIDDVNSVRISASNPISYTLEERRVLSNLLTTMDYKLHGIQLANVFKTRNNSKTIDTLNYNISEVDKLIKNDLIPLQNLFFLSQEKPDSNEDVILELAKTSLKIKELQEDIYKILSQLKMDFS